jgi:hypothetical protein
MHMVSTAAPPGHADPPHGIENTNTPDHRGCIYVGNGSGLWKLGQATLLDWFEFRQSFEVSMAEN